MGHNYHRDIPDEVFENGFYEEYPYYGDEDLLGVVEAQRRETEYLEDRERVCQERPAAERLAVALKILELIDSLNEVD